MTTPQQWDVCDIDDQTMDQIEQMEQKHYNTPPKLERPSTPAPTPPASPQTQQQQQLDVLLCKCGERAIICQCDYFECNKHRYPEHEWRILRIRSMNECTCVSTLRQQEQKDKPASHLPRHRCKCGERASICPCANFECRKHQYDDRRREEFCRVASDECLCWENRKSLYEVTEPIEPAKPVTEPIEPAKPVRDAHGWRIKRVPTERYNAFSAEQKVAYDRIVNDHANTVVLGMAGTGKTKLINELCATFETLDLAVSATTGAAANLITGCTFHKLFGVGLMKGSPEGIWSAMIKSSWGKAIVSNLQRVRLVIIDEVSMMSALAFEMIEYVARRARDQMDVPFGGLNVVFVGDFYQLKPVCAKGDDPRCGHYAFESSKWFEVFPESSHIELLIVYRQEDLWYKSVLQDVRSAVFSNVVKELINRTKRALEPKNGVRPTFVCCKRKAVYDLNVKQLNELPGELYELKAYDTFAAGADTHAVQSLNRDVPAAALLQLKVGAQVMIIKNMSTPTPLFNGQRGVVVSVEIQSATSKMVRAVNVQFVNGDVAAITQESFEQYGLRGEVMATRMQYPLQLAWASTIHKIQGQTLDYAVVDLMDCWEPGQAYVGLSRVRSVDSLQIVNMDASALRQTAEVKQFYERIRKAKEDKDAPVVKPKKKQLAKPAPAAKPAPLAKPAPAAQVKKKPIVKKAAPAISMAQSTNTNIQKRKRIDETVSTLLTAKTAVAKRQKPAVAPPVPFRYQPPVDSGMFLCVVCPHCDGGSQSNCSC